MEASEAHVGLFKCGERFKTSFLPPIVSFWSLHLFTVRKIGDFPHFLSALTSNNQFIIKLVKMLPGGAPHVVVGTLKISLDRLKMKKKKKKKEFSRVL